MQLVTNSSQILYLRASCRNSFSWNVVNGRTDLLTGKAGGKMPFVFGLPDLFTQRLADTKLRTIVLGLHFLFFYDGKEAKDFWLGGMIKRRNLKNLTSKLLADGYFYLWNSKHAAVGKWLTLRNHKAKAHACAPGAPQDGGCNYRR